MKIEEIQEKAINTYNKNLEFLKKNNIELFEKVKLFEEAISLNHLKPRYILEYKEECYFDVFDNQTQSWIYGTNSQEFSTSIVKDINKEAKKHSFKTFYEYRYDNEVVENAKRASILSQSVLSISPIVSYTQNNLDEKQEMKNIFKYFVFGIGLGLHIPKIHEKIKAKVYLLVEPSLELFRLSLFVTDYSQIDSAKVHFAVAMNENEFKDLVYVLSEQTFMFDYYIKFFMFSINCDSYINIIQNHLVSQSHLLYSFDRQLESLKRTYEYFYDNFSYIDISTKKEFLNKPVLVLAMGPSLQKSIEFVKKNKDKFIIIAIYATMPLLEEHGIKPDIITQFDQQEKVVLSTLEKVNDIEFFSNSLFLFASHINEKLMKSFPKENIYVYQALFEAKKEFGTITAPSIGEITYALSLLFGAKQIYLLGLDLALGDDGSSHSGEHDGAKAYEEVEEKSNQNFSFKKNIIKIKGNFREVVDTLPVFKSSIGQMNIFSRLHKRFGVEVYNLSDGAYFDSTITQKIEEIEESKLITFDKTKELNFIKNSFDECSIKGVSQKDEIFFKQKYLDAQTLLEILDSFNRRKYSKFLDYINGLFKLYEDLIYSDLQCKDLQEILSNFYRYTLPPIFYLANMKTLDNPKRHIKQSNKVLYMQTKKIFDEYFKIVGK